MTTMNSVKAAGNCCWLTLLVEQMQQMELKAGARKHCLLLLKRILGMEL